MIGKGEKGTATHERDIFIGCLRRRSLPERRHYLVIACGLDWSLLHRIQDCVASPSPRAASPERREMEIRWRQRPREE